MVMVLKPLESALRDHDYVYATVCLDISLLRYVVLICSHIDSWDGRELFRIAGPGERSICGGSTRRNAACLPNGWSLAE